MTQTTDLIKRADDMLAISEHTLGTELIRDLRDALIAAEEKLATLQGGQVQGEKLFDARNPTPTGLSPFYEDWYFKYFGKKPCCFGFGSYTNNTIQNRFEAFKAGFAAVLSVIPAQRTMPSTDFGGLVVAALAEAEAAMQKFPQPNYIISKIAEEAGEVVKAAIHCAEGRETPENVRGEMKQLIAMLYRLWVEGDGVHGLPAVRALPIPHGEAK